MEQEIFSLACAILHPAQEEKDHLSALCSAWERKLLRRCRRSLKGGDRDAFLCAAAWLCAADFLCVKSAGTEGSWKAGDVSVQAVDAAQTERFAQNLRRSAEMLLSDCLTDDTFAFLGVRG